jgi:hypothetical protein
MGSQRLSSRHIGAIDLWALKYNIAAESWRHIAPIPNNQMEADIDCSNTQYPARFAIAADFDGDGADELVVAPDASGTRGNDLWVMKYVGRFPAGQWQHMALIPNHQMEADIDCSNTQYPARFAIAADFDGDGADELIVAPEQPYPGEGFLWAIKYFGTFPGGAFGHMDGDIIFLTDRVIRPIVARVGVFDGRGPELVVEPEGLVDRL